MPNDEKKTCPICFQNAHVRSHGITRPESVECPRCGRFQVESILRRTVIKGKESDSETKELLPYLSIYTRQATERRETVVLVAENWKGFALAQKSTPVSRKTTKLLGLLAARSTGPGFPVQFNPKIDPPLVDAATPNELGFLLEQLAEVGYIRQEASWVYTLKAKGWEKLEATTAQGGIFGKCFVAMSFDATLQDAYENGISPAVKQDCKMDPVRIDRVHHNEKICDKIIAEIRTCQFLVADVTLQRAGVYFEAGFAMGLGRPVIWTCRDDDLENVHFDTRQYNHIVWTTPEDLREKLRDRIKATIPGAA